MKKQFCIAVVLMGFLFLSSCSSNSNIDGILDKYEDIVKKYENMADEGDITLANINSIMQETQEFANEVEKYKGTGEWTDSHLRRYTDLTSRLSKALSKVSGSQMPNMPKINY